MDITTRTPPRHWLRDLPEMGSPGYKLADRIDQTEVAIEAAEKALIAALARRARLEAEADDFAGRNWRAGEIDAVKAQQAGGALVADPVAVVFGPRQVLGAALMAMQLELAARLGWAAPLIKPLTSDAEIDQELPDVRDRANARALRAVRQAFQRHFDL